MKINLIVIFGLLIYFLYFYQQENFNNEIILYNFNTDWCGYSREFQPIWNKFSKNNKSKAKIKDIKCDKSKNKELCEKYRVSGYPSVIAVKGSETIEYDGSRSVKSLETFLNTLLK